MSFSPNYTWTTNRSLPFTLWSFVGLPSSSAPQEAVPVKELVSDHDLTVLTEAETPQTRDSRSTGRK